MKTVQEVVKELDIKLNKRFNTSVSICLKQVRGEIDEVERDVQLEIQNSRAYKEMKEAFSTRDTQWKEAVLEVLGGKKKPELAYADIQLLDRHEREEYNEEVVGYNSGIDIAITAVEALFDKKE